MLKRGGGPDIERAAAWFVKWWREEGCAISANAPFGNEYDDDGDCATQLTSGQVPVLEHTDPSPYTPGASSRPVSMADAAGRQRGGWGFDFQWEIDAADVATARADTSGAEAQKLIQREMERGIDEYVARSESEKDSEDSMSNTQQKKREKEEKRVKREKRIQRLLAERRAGKR